ncbi:MAG: DUF3138 domain-containing protein [Pseudomonadota bacterium]
MQSSTRWLGAAALLALYGVTPPIEAAPPSNEALQKQIEALQKTVEVLQKKLEAQPVVSAQAEKNTSDAVLPEEEAGLETATKQDVEGIRADLENYKYEQQRRRDTATANTTRGTTLGGTVQVRAGWQNPRTGAGSTALSSPRNSSFDIPLAQFGASGSLFKDYSEGKNLDYRLFFAYAKNNPATNNSNFNLTDAYLRYSFLPTVTGLEEPKLTVTVGQQLIPFGLEAQADESLRPTIVSAQFVSNLGVGTRQVGAIIRGDYKPYVDYGFNYRAPLLEYALGVVNGSGPNKSDDNGRKDFLGRLAFTLPVDYNSAFRELKLGASIYSGKKNLNSPTAVVTQGKTNRYGFDIYYNHAPFGATYEFAQGKDDALTSSNKAGGSAITSRGHVLTAFYTWGEQWVNSSKTQSKYDDWWPKSHQLFYRWDQWEPNRAVGNDKVTINTLGYNLFFAQTTKLQLNFNHYTYQKPATSSVNEILAQFQYGF